MTENPFSDSVPTHFAIAATVYTKPLVQLEDETKTTRSKLVFAVGDYGNGKSHALERLKNDINVEETKKLAIYTSAFATKSMSKIYETICSELLSGKISKLETSPVGRAKMLSAGIPEKIVEMLYTNEQFRSTQSLAEIMPFGKVISSSSDIINFICGISVLVEQFVLLIDDIEEAATLDKNERQLFFGYIRALYDQCVRKGLKIILVLALTPEKLLLLKSDRADLYRRVDRAITFLKPTLKEMSEIVQKRLEISGLMDFKISEDVMKNIHSKYTSIREIFNILRDLFEKAQENGKNSITKADVLEDERLKFTRAAGKYKPADESILKVLREKPGLYVHEIVKTSKMSAPWIQHRLAELVRMKILRKEQIGRNRPAKYYLNEEMQ